MLKIILIVVFVIAVCGFMYGFSHGRALSKANEKDMEKYKNVSFTLNDNSVKALVVYYSYGGNTEKIADIIKEKINADVYKIELEKPYGSYLSLLLKCKREAKPENYPKLKGSLPDFSSYDIIFVGGPVWAWTVSAPILSFLSQADFEGKTVIPFAAHGGNPGKYFEDFNKNAKNAKIGKKADFFKVSKENQNALENKIIDWLNDNFGDSK